MIINMHLTTGSEDYDGMLTAGCLITFSEGSKTNSANARCEINCLIPLNSAAIHAMIKR
ncbi:MAG: hypothetical protein WBW72_07835 [Erwinia billingiae]|jgi:hypothetical protein